MITGCNTNVLYRGKQFHVQTEDSGRANPHIISHVYHGGTIIASEKSSYSDRIDAEELDIKVRAKIELQHKTMLKRLTGGELDEVIDERLGGAVAAKKPSPPRVGEVSAAERTASGAETSGSVTSGAATDPAGSVTSGAATDPAGSVTSGAATDPAGSVTSGAATDPAGSVTSGAATDPAGSVTSGAATDPAGSVTSGAATDPAGSVTSGAATDPAGSVTSGAATDPSGSVTSGAATAPAGSVASGAATDPAGSVTSGAATDPAIDAERPGVDTEPIFDAPPTPGFGKGPDSEKPLDEVILEYLVDKARDRAAGKKQPPARRQRQKG